MKLPQLCYVEWLLEQQFDKIEEHMNWGLLEFRGKILKFWSNIPTNDDHVATCRCWF